MLEIILGFLLIALSLYVIFGGADFGAGILELFCPRHERRTFRELINRTIGPVWEANHIWLILVVVIVFSAFPSAFHQISITFHFPILLMLFGIVLRGCAFTFRHYDAVKDESQEYYSGIFALSSLLTPFAQGVIAGGVIMGRIESEPSSFYLAYIAPWFNLFSCALGVLFCLLCTLSAAVFLYSEKPGPRFQPMLAKRITQTTTAAFCASILVFVAARAEDFPLISLFFTNLYSVLAFSLASFLLLLLIVAVRYGGGPTLLRGIVIAFSTLLLMGWWILQFPNLLGIEGGGGQLLNLYDAAAPASVQKQILIALIAGSCLIFPALFFLFRTFKFEKRQE